MEHRHTSQEDVTAQRRSSGREVDSVGIAVSTFPTTQRRAASSKLSNSQCVEELEAVAGSEAISSILDQLRVSDEHITGSQLYERGGSSRTD
eukprot:5773070-Pleurochrysis_carterae.AAC.1